MARALREIACEPVSDPHPAVAICWGRAPVVFDQVLRIAGARDQDTDTIYQNTLTELGAICDRNGFGDIGELIISGLIDERVSEIFGAILKAAGCDFIDPKQSKVLWEDIKDRYRCLTT